MAKPTLYYFEIRGRGEPVRLALSAKLVDFEVASIDYQQMKSDLTAFPFAQCPRYTDGEVDMGQSNAIMRHLGRKYDLYGASRVEAAMIDQFVDGVEDIKRKYLALIYQDQLADAAKKAYWETHFDSASAHGRNGGAHFLYLSNLLKKNANGAGWCVGAELSIADILMFDIVDLHLRIFEEQIKANYPELVGLWERVAAIPGIKSYLASPLRLPKVNNNGLG